MALCYSPISVLEAFRKALHVASNKGHDRIVLEKGANVNFSGGYLSWQRSTCIVVRMLLKKGADLHALVRWTDAVVTSCTRRCQESAADVTGCSIHQLPRRCYCRVLQATFPSGYKKVLGHRKKRDLPCSGVSWLPVIFSTDSLLFIPLYFNLPAPTRQFTKQIKKC